LIFKAIFQFVIALNLSSFLIEVWMTSKSFMQWGDYFLFLVNFFFCTKATLHCLSVMFFTLFWFFHSCQSPHHGAGGFRISSGLRVDAMPPIPGTRGTSRPCAQALGPRGSMRVTVRIN
jgi:hypothetical protein